MFSYALLQIFTVRPSVENIYLLTISVLLGVLLVMLIFNTLIWLSTKDKVLGLYNLYLVTCLMLVLYRFGIIFTGSYSQNFMENTLAGELLGAVSGLVYIYFIGNVFLLQKAQNFYRCSWKVLIGIMYLQLMYLLICIAFDQTKYYDNIVWSLLINIVSILGLIILFYAFLVKKKSSFQKIIFYGSCIFFILISIANFQDYYNKLGLYNGLNGLFIALLVEQLFFAFASGYRIKDVFTESEKLKTISYQYQLEIEQVVNFFATSINEQESIDDMLWDVAKNCISKLGFEDCVIYLKDENRDMLIQKAAWGPKTTMDDKIINPIEIPIGKGVVGSVAVTGKAEIIADTSTDGRYIPDDANRLSELTVPIVDNGQVIGIIDSENHFPNFYTQRHLQILTTVASLCSEKIDKMKAEQQTREKQLEVLQLSSDLATSQLTALRAQMNPHFIFNALNSIQQFVLQGNVDEANRYLSRFSKLQREILNNSDQQFIPLEKEKEILEIYLQLEQLRFDDSFSYAIYIDSTIDTDEVMIPPMIIQPFVENAIWHGLSPKKGNKKVIIEFELEDEQTLTCIISDNGIGREASAKLKSTTGRHKSRGLSLVYERLAILKKQYNQPFEVSIADILSPEGDSAGTRITLRLFSGTQIHN